MTVTGGPKPKAVQVADALREDVKRMKPGDKLPSQRELIERFGYASQTIQNGLAMLRSEGLVVSAGNLGNFVGDGTVPQNDVRGEINEIRSLIQALAERVEALEERSTVGGA
ncbi:winged helix-turn-helix domain-containing protein [Streptomyces iranensis]|uniref:DNA-binding GntR family transcriptional regulator n=1 Tax=Streptomyces iranensis TaxID=576784 RepID=A0ABS4MMV7_9ACTN|nr:winged helix-turn-helix domain-containing protein [Streptomyces iranensis]MBP2061050.1 DNA-binding GntR family transcriptional regulator [Streptomyces iranensis]